MEPRKPTPLDDFLFDLRGYLILDNAVEAGLLADLNRVLAAGPTAITVRTVGGRIALAPSRRFDTAAAILADRVILFWLPLVVGGAAFLSLRKGLQDPNRPDICDPLRRARGVTVS